MEQAGTDVLVRGRDNVPVDKLWLHLEIQSNTRRTYELYQVAMTLWH